MLFFDFENAEKFWEKYGKRNESRRKKLAIAIMRTKWYQYNYLKPAVFDGGFKAGTPSSSMVYDEIKNRMAGRQMKLNGQCFYSTSMKTDDHTGICLDGDFRSIRYTKEVETDNGTEIKVYKMKAGKMFRRLCEENDVSDLFNDAVINYACEEAQRRWEAYAEELCNGDSYHLVVDDDFGAIYDSNNYFEGADFGSCMTDEDQHYFYEEAVEAKAASLQNEDGAMLARCIVFTDVKDDQSGEVLKLGERQYSANGSELFKRILVNKLIDAGEIDGYKRVGADCHSSSAFVSNSGEDWSGRKFSIRCCLDYGDTLSYQDSFKHYDRDNNRAYNYRVCTADIGLDTTDNELEGEYDDYHECYCRETVQVHCDGRWIACDIEDLDDFVQLNGDYYHVDEVATCDECGEDYLIDDGYYSEITDCDYCCRSCREDAEQRYKEENWYYSDLTEEYYKDEDERDDAEQEYKEENGWFYSEILGDWFEDEDEMKDAEMEYGEKYDTYSTLLNKVFWSRIDRTIAEDELLVNASELVTIY